ncbi:DUF5688 family protein [Butyrivibrio sp. LC3010]|uniref:DUF5688 family protein n=1 Tax=Butyrivibrio sp. LC3010 TaxID=1280680 RepID=UPI0012DDF59B|nr:DUF5688 family protein [Butyrivibrio sp. LC3010]
MNRMVISDFMDFKNEVVKNIVSYLPAEYEGAVVELKEVVKNNDQRLTGIVVKKEDSNIAPNIYLEGFFRDHENGKAFEDVMRDIAALRVEHEISNIDVSYITDYEACRGKVVPRLVNADMNEELLSERPHRIIEDLAVIYALDMNEGMSIPISEQMMGAWGMDEEKLHTDAIENLPRILPAKLSSIGEVLRAMMPLDEFSEMRAEMFPVDDTFYVLSNKRNVYGAAALLDKNMMNEIIEKLGEGFFILPSSVHEVLIIPDKNCIQVKDLKNMVREVNATTVSEEDKLSDSIYRYSAENGLARVEVNERVA